MKKKTVALFLIVIVAAAAFISWNGGSMASLGGDVFLKQDGETIPLRTDPWWRRLLGLYIAGSWRIQVYNTQGTGISALVMFVGFNKAHTAGTDSSGYLEHYTGFGIVEIRVSKSGYIKQTRTYPNGLSQTFYLQPKTSSYEVSIDTSPVKGRVTIRKDSSSGPVVADGTAPVKATNPSQWTAYIKLGDVSGYSKPNDVNYKLNVDTSMSYTYNYIPDAPDVPAYSIKGTEVHEGTEIWAKSHLDVSPRRPDFDVYPDVDIRVTQASYSWTVKLNGQNVAIKLPSKIVPEPTAPVTLAPTARIDLPSVSLTLGDLIDELNVGSNTLYFEATAPRIHYDVYSMGEWVEQTPKEVTAKWSYTVAIVKETS